ncbi:nucleolar protein 58 [Sporothrix brasiliensis 5110]|uniref:Nucleolar protein 58 n=1 Tax=Sporothrix brasiliensis 5110 TaxID=1398154 RepID=A0A0C2IYY4_9PEZI|nr:nucleolar protein 58 [Sporothrix brasiliensis 5110]KIH94331.1 nucleolar protein 58 [Sporothrix brasiliensis 5110]
MAPLYLLSETSAGYGLFQVKDKKLIEGDDVTDRLSTLDKINKEVQFNLFKKWNSAVEAVAELDKLIDGKIPPILTQLLEEVKEKSKKATILVEDKALGNTLQKLPGYNLTAIPAGPGTAAGEVFRGIRQHLSSLIPDIDESGFKTMSLGLSHSLSRHKLKFSADKVDVMIIHAVSLLDDLDKELNVFMMRVKEWYGWHFPELAKILNDNVAYSRVILAAGMRENLVNTDLSEVLPEEIEAAVKAAAEVSMGSEIASEDLENITLLAEYVVMYANYRTQLSSYLDSRMKAIAPNMTAIVGPLIGARLISHAGSLMNLAKSPGSTIQILGAEKALFRALKTKHSTPKYGLIYHASLVGQATGRNKGKMARQVASKAALGARIDALAEYEDEETVDDDIRATLGLAARAKLELSLSRLEHKPLSKIAATNGVSTVGKWDVAEARKYNADADGLTGNEEAAAEQAVSKSEKKDKKDKKEKKEKKEKKDTKAIAAPEEDTVMESNDEAANGTSGPAKLTEEEYEQFAEAAGISVSKFKRKYERGDVEIGKDGKPVVHSKKELKKLRKAEKKAEEESSSKRKRDDDAETPKKKKKKHSDA